MSEAEQIDLEVGAVAHGGHFVARTRAGQVVFVRHALPGERVRARLTGAGGSGSRRGFRRADAVEILDPSPDRVAPPCPYAGPGRCGGCDFQHVALPRQRELKAQVVREQLTRLGGLSAGEAAALDVRVSRVDRGQDDGLGWRTRVQYTMDARARPGLRQHRSHEVVPIDRCLIAHPGVQDATVDGVGVLARDWPGFAALEVTAAGQVTVLGRRGPGRAEILAGPERITRRAIGRTWRLAPGAFWQVHPAAADTLAAAVVDLLRPRAGQRAWDLYGGAGLFAAALAPHLDHTGRVTVIESDRAALAAARESLADLPNVCIVSSDVERAVANPRWVPGDLVVLDPPRAGAGPAVIDAILAGRASRRAPASEERGAASSLRWGSEPPSGARTPRAVAYVACDPAALARDIRRARAAGAELAALRAFDLFPQTHHVECVALLLPGPRRSAQ